MAVGCGLFYGVRAVEALTDAYSIGSRSGAFADLLDVCTCKEKGERNEGKGASLISIFGFASPVLSALL